MESHVSKLLESAAHVMQDNLEVAREQTKSQEKELLSLFDSRADRIRSLLKTRASSLD